MVISCLLNLAIMMGCNSVLPENISEAFSEKTAKEKLTYDMILKIMAGTTETCHSPLGRAMYVLMIVFSTPFCPWYKTSYNGCNFDTYKESV